LSTTKYNTGIGPHSSKQARESYGAKQQKALDIRMKKRAAEVRRYFNNLKKNTNGEN